jgi:hypothetical protein
VQAAFPKPAAMIAGRNYWQKREARSWLAAACGKPEPEPLPDDEVLLNSAQIRAMFGDVSDMWLWRRRFPAKAKAAAKRRPAKETADVSSAA